MQHLEKKIVFGAQISCIVTTMPNIAREEKKSERWWKSTNYREKNTNVGSSRRREKEEMRGKREAMHNATVCFPVLMLPGVIHNKPTG